jgi:hypothetical protein
VQQPTSLGDSRTVFTQRYDSLNREVGGPLTVGGPVTGSSFGYTILADAHGGYSVTLAEQPLFPTPPLKTIIHFDQNQRRLVLADAIPGNAFVLALAGERYILFADRASSPFRQFLDSAGNPVGDSTPLETLPFAAIELVDGSFVAFNRSGFTAQRFDSTGAPLGRLLTLEASGSPQVAALADGGFAIAWSGQITPNDFEVFSQRFVQVLTTPQAKKRECLDSAKGMTGRQRKAFLDWCLAA